tara:strand:- start:154 stop:594 length:441 start_codon:yes stop_codon:yes gene_type:complete
MKKRGQMKLSFGMIFSIILIIIFIAFAAYGISKFLGLQQTAQIETFKADLQEDINKLWKNEGSSVHSYSIPKNSKICFFNFNEKGIIRIWKNDDFLDEKDFKNNVDLEKGIFIDQNNCAEEENGKIRIQLERNYGASQVTINKVIS